MKIKLMVFLISSFVSTVHSASSNYQCLDKESHVTQLTIEDNRESVLWSEEHAATSSGEPIGRETSTSSESKGYDLFHLKNFRNTDSSDYILAVEPSAKDTFKVAVYVDKNGQESQLAKYDCRVK